MAKKRRPESQEGYPELAEVLTLETASILTDYIRQYIGPSTPTPGSGIFINWDRVLRTQVYQELAWYDMYDEIERDPHIAGILRTLKLATSSLEWRVAPADDSGRSKAIASFVETNLKQMRSFTQDLYELLDAEGKGFAVSEVVWEVDYETRVKSLLNRPQRRFQFDAVTRQPKLRTIANPYYGEDLPPRKFIIHRVSAKYENPFGDALDQSLYWMWLFKRTVIKYWMTHLDVASAPVPFVQHPANANKALKDEALAIASQMRRSGYGRLPDNFKIIWAEAQSSAQTSTSYERFQDFCNTEMTKCVLGQVLTTEGSAKGGAGSKALGEVHSDVLMLRAKYSAKALEATLNDTLIKWLVDANYAGIKEYPRFEFATEDPTDRQYEAQLVKTLKDAGYKVDPKWVEATIQVDLVENDPPPVVTVPGQPPPVPEDPEEKKEDDLKEMAEQRREEKREERDDRLYAAVIGLASRQPVINVEASRAPVVNVAPPQIQFKQEPNVIHVHVPEQQTPIVNVEAPKAPVVNVSPPKVEFKQESPVVHVHVPEQPPPVVNVKVERGPQELIVERDGQGYVKSIKGK